MRKSDLMIRALMKSNLEFIHFFKEYLKREGVSINEFSKESRIPLNTLYKLTSSQDKDFRISTLRQLYQSIDKLSGLDKPFVALISSRGVLDRVRMKSFNVGGKDVFIREYPSLSIEEVLKSAVRAEKDGALGVICGPIAASIIGDVLSIPISSIYLDEEGVQKAITVISNKIQVRS